MYVSVTVHILFLRENLSLNPELADLASLASNPVSASQVLGLKVCSKGASVF